MRSVLEPFDRGAVAAIQLVVLPGAYQSATDCLDSGLLGAVRRRGIEADVSGVDLELQHLADRAAADSLRAQIILPARARGARSVWLIGISLGGYIALDYASRHRGEVDGICMLAPYLGSRPLAAEIARAGGLDRWSPGPLATGDLAAGDLAAGDEERRIWEFIRSSATSADTERPRLYLGAGDRDRFAHAHALAAAVLPARSVDIITGGHDWETWRTLWERFLDTSRL
jgi:pimeloyl-ACP methyl ester carboxylesterase